VFNERQMDEVTLWWMEQDVPVWVRLLVAAGTGFLIGLEREFAKQVREPGMGSNGRLGHQFAGLRTYTLITLFGFLAALLAEEWGVWLYIVSLAGFFGLVITSYLISVRGGDVGATSEITAMLAFLLGGLAFQGQLLLAVGLAVLMALLLSFKLPLHRFVKTLTEQDVRAIIEFVIISALVLPFLPNTGYGPHGSFNPKEIWTMVILVSGIGLAGYLLSKVLGGSKGTLWAGVLGGLVSSTAVALTFARRAREGSGPLPFLALSIIASSAIMFPRVLLEVVVVAPALAGKLWLPIGLIALAGFGVAFAMLRTKSSEEGTEAPLTNPLNLRVALQFALIYAAVRWLTSFAQERFGDTGTYVAGLLSGATDMDAITLGMARMSNDTCVTHTAMITILLAALSNTLVKFVIVVTLGGPALRKAVTPGFAAMFLVTLACIGWVALR
jgi:uncharacterized membrane protein (DUF4010 family)